MRSLCGVTRSDEVGPTVQAMASESPSRGATLRPPRGLRNRVRHLGRDYLYILPGLPLSVVSLSILVLLTLVSVGTVVIWVGALLMPVTLLIASSFANLSRRRLRAWGLPPAPVTYLPRSRGPFGLMRLMADPRRWLDLAFETVLAFPLRLTTFVVAVGWTGLALGGITLWAWRAFMQTQSLWPVGLLQLTIPQLVPHSDLAVYLIDAGANFVLGILALLTLPAVVRGMALFDGFLTHALLGGEGNRMVDDDGAGSESAAPTPGLLGWTRRRPAASPATRWVWASTCFVALALLAVAWPLLVALYGVPPALAMVLSVGHSGALVVALRWPWAGIGVSALASLGVMLATVPLAGQLPWPWPVTAIVAQSLLVAVLALRHEWYWPISAWGAGALLTALSFMLIQGGAPGGLANGVVLVSVTAGLALLGVLERLWRQGTARAQQAEELSAEEAQRRRDLEERNRIARDLHDVVAHSMSVINVQSSTARYRKAGIDPSVQQEFDDIANSSRQALAEMRSLLAVLRGGDDAPTAPVPTLADIPDLVETARASGATITDRVDGQVPATVGVTAYRIVQEALSNALRHSPGSSIEVTTAMLDRPRELRVAVVNSAPQDDAVPAPGSGFGLAGIRERVSALGGHVEAGPTDEGGFQLVAHLPVAAERDGTN